VPFGQQQPSGQQDGDEQRELQRVAQQKAQQGRQQLAQAGAALVRRAIGVGAAFLVFLAAAAVARVVAARLRQLAQLRGAGLALFQVALARPGGIDGVTAESRHPWPFPPPRHRAPWPWPGAGTAPGTQGG
jgi:hypothetical protein